LAANRSSPLPNVIKATGGRQNGIELFGEKVLAHIRGGAGVPHFLTICKGERDYRHRFR